MLVRYFIDNKLIFSNVIVTPHVSLAKYMNNDITMKLSLLLRVLINVTPGHQGILTILNKK